MTEQLHIQGLGATREAALSDADAQALAYFGATQPTTRDIGTASVQDRLIDGSVLTWSVVCTYRPELRPPPPNPATRPPRNPYEAS